MARFAGVRSHGAESSQELAPRGTIRRRAAAERRIVPRRPRIRHDSTTCSHTTSNPAARMRKLARLAGVRPHSVESCHFDGFLARYNDVQPRIAESCMRTEGGPERNLKSSYPRLATYWGWASCLANSSLRSLPNGSTSCTMLLSPAHANMMRNCLSGWSGDSGNVARRGRADTVMLRMVPGFKSSWSTMRSVNLMKGKTWQRRFW